MSLCGVAWYFVLSIVAISALFTRLQTTETGNNVAGTVPSSLPAPQEERYVLLKHLRSRYIDMLEALFVLVHVHLSCVYSVLIVVRFSCPQARSIGTQGTYLYRSFSIGSVLKWLYRILTSPLYARTHPKVLLLRRLQLHPTHPCNEKTRSNPILHPTPRVPTLLTVIRMATHIAAAPRMTRSRAPARPATTAIPRRLLATKRTREHSRERCSTGPRETALPTCA